MQVKDLLVIVREVGDTTGEAFEVALARLGIDSNNFGRENLERLRRAAAKGDALFDLNNPEGDRIAKDLVQLADTLVRKVHRGGESLAGLGNVHKGLEYLGYGTSVVLGTETAVFQGAAKGAQLTKQGAGALADAIRARQATLPLI
jgi:hypothetical protein